MVLVTHDSTIARRAQRIGIMKNGRLSFKQPRPSQRSQAARPGAVGTGTASGAGARPAPAPPSDLRAPDLPDLEDAEHSAFQDSDPSPADTVTFD